MFQMKVVDKIKTRFMFSNFPPPRPPPENRAVCEIMWKNIVERGRSRITQWRMRIGCWLRAARHTLRMCKYLLISPNAPRCYVVLRCPSCFFF